MRADQTRKNDLSCTRFSRLVHFTVAFMEALTVDRSYVRWLGHLKLPVSTWKYAVSSGCHFLLPVVLCYPAKGKSRRRGLIKGEPPAQTLEILSRLQGADTNYVIVRVFNIKGIYGIYRKVLYYLKILRRIFTLLFIQNISLFLIGSNPPAKYS